jgi:hypothetical protein
MQYKIEVHGTVESGLTQEEVTDWVRMELEPLVSPYAGDIQSIVVTPVD